MSIARRVTGAPRRPMLVGLLALLAACLALVVAACSSQTSLPPGVIPVVAGENFWGDIAAQIGGSHVHVTSILSNPNADPHLYESDASDAAAVAQADLVIQNGAGYDDWLSRLLGATSHSGRVVISVQQVLGMTGSDVNPHFWYDTPQVPRVADAIEAALARIDPQGAGAFAANLATFNASLQPINAVLQEIRQRYPGAPVAYTERVSEYLLQAAGLSIKTPESFAMAIEEGNDPSPQDSLAMQQLISGHLIKLLVYNEQAVSAVTQHIQSLARQAGIPVVGVTETLPPSYKTYQAWQLAQARAILKALGG